MLDAGPETIDAITLTFPATRFVVVIVKELLPSINHSTGACSRFRSVQLLF